MRNGSPSGVIGPKLRIAEDLSPRLFQLLDRSRRLARGGSQPSIARCFIERSLQACQRQRGFLLTGTLREVRLDSRQPFPTEVPMRRIGLAVALAVSITLAPLTVVSPQEARVYRIDYLGIQGVLLRVRRLRPLKGARRYEA